ncbi:cytochrome c [Legionella impletisoli]|uniref:Cytochrome c n=1 Tax=Legionella impletisoli TaxID=343510 RepID=A0A917JST3_9GAMM|nr:cytochrome c [Legionella impletisoli]
MGSLLKTNALAIYVASALCVCSPSLYAAENNAVNESNQTVNESSKPANDSDKKDGFRWTNPLIDGYYPVYPETKPATGEKEKLIKRGEYLAKLGDCISCHTNVKAGTPPYAGGLPIDTPFGTIYSLNITPDKETGIGKWSEEDFIRAVKHGRDPKGRNYFPVFPYVYFANITDDDARALYYYFMNIPAVNLPNKKQPFPFSMPGASLGMWGWNLLFFFPNQKFEYNPEQTPAWNRGKYIVDGLGHCSMCHTPLNFLGSPKHRFYLTGAFIDGYWAPNITKWGLQGANRYDVADVFIKGELINMAGPVAGPMAEVNHNSLSYLTEEDQLAIAEYLKTVVSEEPLGLAPTHKQPTLKRGKQVYVNTCIICHQDGKMGAPLIGNGAGWTMRLKNSGLSGLYRHAIHGYNSMPPRGACVTCSDEDVMSAVDYLLNKSLSRSEWLDLKSGGVSQHKPDGKIIYKEACAACHDEGKMGAPKIGDQEVWKPLIAQNFDVLIQNTISGKEHPVNGGCKHCTTGEVIEAIKYIVSQSKTEGNYSLW